MAYLHTAHIHLAQCFGDPVLFACGQQLACGNGGEGPWCMDCCVSTFICTLCQATDSTGRRIGGLTFLCRCMCRALWQLPLAMPASTSSFTTLWLSSAFQTALPLLLLIATRCGGICEHHDTSSRPRYMFRCVSHVHISLTLLPNYAHCIHLISSCSFIAF